MNRKETAVGGGQFSAKKKKFIKLGSQYSLALPDQKWKQLVSLIPRTCYLEHILVETTNVSSSSHAKVLDYKNEKFRTTK